MKKAILRKITAAAALLPIETTTRQHTQYFTGAEALAAAKKYGGPKLDVQVNQAYPTTVPRIEEVNHVNVMKQLYNYGGWPAVEKYIASKTTVI